MPASGLPAYVLWGVVTICFTMYKTWTEFKKPDQAELYGIGCDVETNVDGLRAKRSSVNSLSISDVRQPPLMPSAPPEDPPEFLDIQPMPTAPPPMYEPPPAYPETPPDSPLLVQNPPPQDYYSADQ